MNRRLGLLVSAVGALLATALIAAPVWDLWRYRGLRAPIGHVAVGVILPLRSVPAAPPASPAVRAGTAVPAAMPATSAPAVPASTASRSGSAMAPASPIAAASPVPAAVAPAALRAGAQLHKSYSAPQLLPAPPHAPTAASEARGVDEKPTDGAAADEHEQHAPAAEVSTPDSGGVIPMVLWPAPAQDKGPQLPPEPQPGPPTPRPPAPRPRIQDPRHAPEAIPMLTLVAPAVPVAVGDSFTVTVRLSGGSDITSLPFHVEFDPAILQFQFAQRGPVVDSTVPAILLASVNPERPGDLAVGLSLVESSRLLQGSGTVLRLQFLALAPGHSPLGFSRASIRGSMSETLDAQFHGAGVDVR